MKQSEPETPAGLPQSLGEQNIERRLTALEEQSDRRIAGFHMGTLAKIIVCTSVLSSMLTVMVLKIQPRQVLPAKEGKCKAELAEPPPEIPLEPLVFDEFDAGSPVAGPVLGFYTPIVTSHISVWRYELNGTCTHMFTKIVWDNHDYLVSAVPVPDQTSMAIDRFINHMVELHTQGGFLDFTHKQFCSTGWGPYPYRPPRPAHLSQSCGLILCGDLLGLAM